MVSLSQSSPTQRDIAAKPWKTGSVQAELTELFNVPEDFISIQLVSCFLLR